MRNLRRSRGTLCVSAVAIMLLLASAVPVHARKSSSWANAQFAAANRLQQSLEARPVPERTRRDYQRVIAAYQRVYNEAPTAPKADPSVAAAAQLLEEMGRQFKDDEVLRSAIAQYQFLRREYPGSKARFGALFRIGEIYHDDLHDKAQADAMFQEFLHRYPRHPLAAEARKALAEPVQQAVVKPFGPPQAKKDARPPEKKDNASAEDVGPSDSADAAPASGSISRVLGVRHWSTPDYTRVAIDLDQPVKYRAQHIENPDRLFFDLYNSRLRHRFSGTSLDVDDGFLKKIRIAQFAAERTRVVLDLDELTDYHASLQSNPWRLIIDIQNKRLGNTPPSQDTSSKAGIAPAPVETKPTSIAAKAHCGGQDSDGDAEPVDGCESDPVAATEAPKPEPPAIHREEPSKPAIEVVVGSDGVKKTIVYADDDDRTVAKLDAAEVPLSVRPTPAAAPSVQPPPPEPAPKKASKKKSKQKSPPDALDIHEAEPTASGDRSLIRALGLKIGKIVIDPGHGGRDTGTVGPDGLEEKDLVLDVSLRLGRLLASRLGAEVIFTRTDDTFIPLEDRTAIANREGADLFVSVHANSSRDPDARGTETYYLNFTSSPDALEVAARENAISEKSIHELQDLVKKIALKEKIEESQEFATDVESALHSGLSAKNPGLRDRGVKKAPFIVLIGAHMPSILAEISFVSNPADERRLKTPDYRQKIAEFLYRGIARYVSGLSGVKVASKIDKGEGP
jgi:N-acetylmuramoyl-L-alanine amidase